MNLKFLPIIFFLMATASLYSATISLKSDRKSLSTDEHLVVKLTFIDDSKDSIVKVIEPGMEGFEIVNQNQSSSSSFNMIDGNVTYKKEKQFTYILAPTKEGSFTIGPAKLILESGKKIASNKIAIIVAGGSGSKIPENSSVATSNEPSSREEDKGANPFMKPLSKWEKRTGKYFIRVIPFPESEIYQGEPIVIGYYLYTMKNAISDLDVYKMPVFTNSWTEEAESPKRLKFSHRMNLGGRVYDYALLKKYLLIPEMRSEKVTGTQMIMDIVTGGGGFLNFNRSRKRISSPALNTPLKQLPDAENHKNAVFGSFTLFQDKTKVELKNGKLLDTITFKVAGCGNLQAVDIKAAKVPGLKVFSPDIKINAAVKNNRYCGSKTFKFMLKGEEIKTYTIPSFEMEFFDRDKGYYIERTKPITVKVKSVSAGGKGDKKEKSPENSFEYLKEMPGSTTVYSLLPLTERVWFRIGLALPFALLFSSIFFWMVRESARKKKEKAAYHLKQWKVKISKAADVSSLLNIFYDAIKETYGINLKGERAKEIDARYGNSIEDVREIIKEMQYAVYSSSSSENLDNIKKKALNIFGNIGGRV